MGHDGLTRSPSGLSERRTGFSPPELGSPTAPVVPPTGAVPCPDSSSHAHGSGLVGPGTDASSTGCRARGRRPQARGGSWRPRRGSDEPVRMTSHQRVTAVVGASGGLGASTLALAVGRRLAATGPPSVVVDLDLLRGGLEVTAGIEHLPGRRWDDLRHVRGRVPPARPCCRCCPPRRGAPCSPPGAVRRRACPRSRPAMSSPPWPAARPAVVLDLPLASPVLPARPGRRRPGRPARRAAHPGPGRRGCRRVPPPRRPGGARCATRPAPRHPGWAGRHRRRRRGGRPPRGRPPAPPRGRPARAA